MLGLSSFFTAPITSPIPSLENIAELQTPFQVLAGNLVALCKIVEGELKNQREAIEAAVNGRNLLDRQYLKSRSLKREFAASVLQVLLHLSSEIALIIIIFCCFGF